VIPTADAALAPTDTDGPADRPATEQPSFVEVAEPRLPAASEIAASMAVAQLSDENAALRAQIAEAHSAMAKLRQEIIANSEGELVCLALAIAERVVGRELTTDPHLVVAWVREAVDQLAVEENVVIAVARDVAKTIAPDAWRDVGTAHKRQTDPQLAPGTIEVRTPEGTIATGANARLAAVAEALEAPTP
jgi:flagellar assembly protein FliH